MRTPARAKKVNGSDSPRKTEASRLEDLKSAVANTLGIAEEARALGVLLAWYSEYADDDIDPRVIAAGAACVERTARQISDDLSRIDGALAQMSHWHQFSDTNS
jgi:hypothetical protein